ncbi:hypothetical protein M0804_014096 [Polistes exclamans]|nr:hypothetical protein M0804_014096 [Polistes exclamans]
MAVFGGSRTGHPPSTSGDCQESGVGNPAPALVNAPGSSSQVGNLACGLLNASGRTDGLKEWQRAARAVEALRLSGSRSPFWSGKRIRPTATSSEEEEDCVIEETDPLGTKFFIPGEEAGSGLSLAALESRRLTVKLRDLLMGVEAERVQSSNLNGKVSGRIKRNIKEALRITEEINARLGRSSGASSSNTEMVSQLRAEMNLVQDQKRNTEEECIKLRRELKKKKAIITTLQGETAASSQKRASGPLSWNAPANDERLQAARSSLTLIGSIMAVLREMTKGMEVLQKSNREL